MTNEVCPNCARKKLQSRMTKTPEFRCAECGTETDSPASVPKGLDVRERKRFISDSDIDSKNQIQCEDCGGSLEENTDFGSPYICVDCGSEYTVPPVVDEDAVDPDTTEACPECDSTLIHKRITKIPAYRCSECDSTFEEPVVRKLKVNPDPDRSANSVEVKCLSCKNVTLQPETDSRYNCIQCGSSNRVNIAQEYQIVTASEQMYELANGPVALENTNLGTTARRLVMKIKLPSSQKNNDWGVDKTTVYYLPGDKRAALRLFARKHPDEMQIVFESSQTDKLSQTWSDEKINMLRQAWLAVRDDVLSEDTESEDLWVY